MTDAIIGAASALVLVAVLIAAGGLTLLRRGWRWLQREMHL